MTQTHQTARAGEKPGHPSQPGLQCLGTGSMPQPCRRYRRLSLPKKGSYSLGVAIGRVYTRRCRLYLAWFYVQVGFPCTTASACIHAHHYVREQAGGYYRLLNLGTIYQT